MLRGFAVLVAVLGVLALPANGRAQIIQPPVPQETAQNNGRIGTVVEVEGSAAITPVGGMPAMVKVNMPVYLNEIVQTGADARVFILFIDNTNVVLSSDALLRIDKYVYDPDDKTSANNNATYTIEGAFEYVSGLIGHRPNPDVHVETPVGSIGIRGTDFWAGPMDGQYGVAVNEGQVSLATNGGEAIVNKGEGTSVKNMFSRPAPAQAWDQARFRRLAATVRLKHYAEAVSRLRALQSRQPEMRRHYADYVRRAHPHWWHDLQKRRDGQGADRQGLKERSRGKGRRLRQGRRSGQAAAPVAAPAQKTDRAKTTDMWRRRWRDWQRQHLQKTQAEKMQPGSAQSGRQTPQATLQSQQPPPQGAQRRRRDRWRGRD